MIDLPTKTQTWVVTLTDERSQIKTTVRATSQYQAEQVAEKRYPGTWAIESAAVME